MHQLKELRQKHGYTQKYVANALGMTQSGYSRIEREDVKLFKDVICALKKLYDVSADVIIGEEEDNNEKK